VSRDDDAADLEVLDPSPVETFAPRKTERRHPRFLLAGALVVGVVAGSAVTVGID